MWKFVHARRDAIAIALLTLAAVIGVIDSSFLVLQYLAALATDGAPTPCSPSSIVSCTKTVQGAWAHLLLIPNPMLGMLWYSGALLYGSARLLGTTFSRAAKIFVGCVLVLGLIFSYVLYLASVLALRGVCPFCLISTVVSTIILLTFLVDDAESDAPVARGSMCRRLTTLFQAFSVLVFVVGLPVFLAVWMPLLINPMEAIEHWSFPVMIGLILVMLVVDVWAYRRFRKIG